MAPHLNNNTLENLSLACIDKENALSSNISTRLRLSKVLLYKFGAIYAIGLLYDLESKMLHSVKKYERYTCARSQRQELYKVNKMLTYVFYI